MAARVDPDGVKQIIDTDLTDPRIQVFINGANAVVTKNLGNSSLGEDLLTEIERWLSAHFISCFEDNRQAIKQKAGPVEQIFSDIFGMGLDSSTYGQTAKSMDPTGKLSDLGMKTVKILAISESED